MILSQFARRLLTRLASRRSADAKPTQRLTGFEPLEPRTVLSAAGLSHFSGDDYSSHGKGESHGLGAYEKELHSAAEVNKGGPGKSDEQYVHSPHYEQPSQYMSSALNATLAPEGEDTSPLARNSLQTPEPNYSVPGSMLSDRESETEMEPAYSSATSSLAALPGRSVLEDRESEPPMPSNLLNGSMAQYQLERDEYAAPTPVISEAGNEDVAPTYSAPTPPLAAVTPKLSVVDSSIAPASSSYVSKLTTYTTEIVVVHTYDATFAPAAEARVITVPAASASAARLVADAIAGAMLKYISSFSPMVGAASPDRRPEGPASISFTGLRDSVSYVVPARGDGSLALSAEAESVGSKSTGLALRSLVVSLALNSSSSAQADMADRATVVASGDDRLDGQAAAEKADASDATGLIDVESAELLRQKRKAAFEESLSKSKLSSRLERLEDLPGVREAPLLLREIMQLACDAAMANLPSSLTSAAADMQDDGMIEMLATDVVSLVSRGDARQLGPVGPAPRAVTLEAGVATYQAFEVGIDAGDAPENAQIAASSEGTAETDSLAGAE